MVKYQGLRIEVEVKIITRDEFDGRGEKVFRGFGTNDAIKAMRDADTELTTILDFNRDVDITQFREQQAQPCSHESVALDVLVGDERVTLCMTCKATV